MNQRRQSTEKTNLERQEARALVLKYGWNATAYQILNPGFTFWFSAARDAVIGYVYKSGTRVVGGAPICAADRVQAVASEFLDDARRHNAHVCFFGAGARLESLLVRSESWSAASLGAQPSWNPQRWSGIIRERSSLRAQLNRARNKKVTAGIRQNVSASEIRALRKCLGEWLATRGLPPLHFLVEPETLAALEDRLLVVAEHNGRPVGFLVASPVAARNGWLIEQIVRAFAAPNGTAELMIDCVMREMARRAASYATLGLCPLSRHSRFDATRMPPWLRFVLKWTRAHGNRFYNFDGLDAFKSKFEPEQWEEIVALADSRKFPPRALWAIAAAFSAGSPIGLVFRAVVKAVKQELLWLSRGGRRAAT